MTLDLEIVGGRVRQKDRRLPLLRAFDFLLWHRRERAGEEPLAVGWPLANEYRFLLEGVPDGTTTYIMLWGVVGSGDTRTIGLSRVGSGEVVFQNPPTLPGGLHVCGLNIFQKPDEIPYRGTFAVRGDDLPVTAGAIHLSAFQPYYVWVPSWRQAGYDEDEDDYDEGYAA